MKISEHIIKHLAKHDMTQCEFAKRINCSDKSVSKYLAGTIPTAWRCKDIAKELGITVDELLEDL